MIPFPKQPLNQIEGPVYPEYKAALPKFRWSGYNWKADPGLITRDLEHNPATYSYAVLTQPRDYNQRIYGIDSGRDAVNHNVRYPLIRLEDRVPLSRLPRPLVVPRLNPSLSGDGGQVAYGVDNTSISGMSKFLTDRIKGVGLAPREETPFRMGIVDMDLPMPDLEVQLAKTNTGMGMTGWGSSVTVEPDIGLMPDLEVQLTKTNLGMGSAGVVSSVTVEPEVSHSREFFTKVSSGPLDAGTRSFGLTDLSEISTPLLESKMEGGARSAGVTPLATFEPEVRTDPLTALSTKLTPRGLVIGTRVLPGEGVDESVTRAFGGVGKMTGRERPVLPYVVPGEFTKVDDPTVGLGRKTPFFRERHHGIRPRGWVQTGGAAPRRLMTPQLFGLAGPKRSVTAYSFGR